MAIERSGILRLSIGQGNRMKLLNHNEQEL
jgi:hypothetical protein